jgi:hypothetical protein
MITLSWEDDNGATVSVSLDAEDQETHELTNSPTDHEVEEGEDITDNVRIEHDTFSLTGIVSDTPLFGNPGVSEIAEFVNLELQIPSPPQAIGLGPAIAAGVSVLGSLVFGGGGTPSVQMLRLTDVSSRKRAIFTVLKEARDNARSVRIATSMRDYEDMQFVSITATRSPDDGNAVVLTMALREVRTVTSELVLAPEPAEITGTLPVSAGSLTGEENKDPEAKKRSLLKQFKDKISGALSPGGSLDGFL